MTTESQPLIDCRNVRKIFPDSAGVPFAAVDDASFRLSAGEIVGLLGPDGAGKTTLIRLITGLMKPHGGSISVLNLDSVKKSRSIQASIGYMPQKFGLYEDLTVRENMELYARMHGVYGQDREKRFRSLLAMTSLERFTTRLAGKLSGGMKQKLGLCCSLVSSPPQKLADKLGDALDSIVSDLDTLETALTSCHEDILAAMSRLRTSVDAAETLVNDRSWPLPKYREMLFIY